MITGSYAKTNFHQLSDTTNKNEIDLKALSDELAILRNHLRAQAVDPEHDAAIGSVAAAELAAKEGDGPRALEELSRAGGWVLDNASKIGVGIAVAALKSVLGL